MATRRASSPRFRREGEAPPIELTEDDVAILHYVFRHRFVRADDLYRLFPGRSPDRLSRRLTLLYRNHYIDRPSEQIDRFHTGGSQPLVYGLDTAGARHLKETLGVSIGSSDWKARNRSYRRENLDHTLAVSRFMIDLELACRARQDVSVISFEEILSLAPDNIQRSPNPARWPVNIRYNGSNATVTIAPDAIFGLRLHRQNSSPLATYFFIEIDRGTMTIVPSERVRESDAFIHRATILRKLLIYAESWRQGLHKDHFGIPSARIFMLTTAQVRADAIRTAAYEQVVRHQHLPPSMFLFGVLGSNDPLNMPTKDASGRVATLLT